MDVCFSLLTVSLLYDELRSANVPVQKSITYCFTEPLVTLVRFRQHHSNHFHMLLHQ